MTIHQVSAGLDEGDILFQRRVDFNPEEETFETTYKKLNDEMQALFQKNWEKIFDGTWKAYASKQNGAGTYHTISDLKNLRKQTSFQWSENITDFLNRYHVIQEERLCSDMEKR